jgi:RimJ/RimL family protein N-acetyltransferase
VRFVLTGDPEAFAARAEGFLAGRVERNVLATVLAATRAGRFTGAGRLFAVGLDGGGAVRAAALRVPPWPLLTSRLDEAAADALTGQWLARDPALPGVVAEAETSRAIAASFTRRTGRPADCRMREAMHLLTDLRDPPRPTAGHLRLATTAERCLLIGWEQAFAREAGVTGEEQAARTVDGRLARGAQLVWDDGGPVATLAMTPPIARTVRIGPVYTPPERRRRGYATSAVAAASRRALADCADRCALFTDLANPTSNRIYAAIGYRRVGDWEEHAFAPEA